MDTLKFGYKYFRKSMPLAIFAELICFVAYYAELLLPLLSGLLIDFVILNGTVEEGSGGAFHFLLTGEYGEVQSMELFFSIATVFGVMILTRVVLIYVRDLIQEWVGLRLETDIRHDAYAKLMELDTETITKYNTGELLQIQNSDTIQFKEIYAHRIPYILDLIFQLVLIFIFISKISIYFIFIPLVLMPFLVKTLIEFKNKARVNFKDIRDRSSELNLSTQENIAAVRIVRSFTNEELEKKKFEKANTNFSDARLKQIWLSSKFDLTFNTIKQIAYISTIVLGAILAIKGYMTVGYIMASSTYMLRIMNNIIWLNNFIFGMQQQLVAGVALKEFIEKDSTVSDSKKESLRSDTPNIELKNVSLHVDDQDLLKNINLSIPYGKKLGIVGETGSGKSVLIKTLVRTREITGGSLTIDGHDIKDFSLESLRDMYSYVFQDVFLFSNTIESNIAFDKPYVDEKLVTKAATLAQADNFIVELSERYKTVVGERGLGLSGGQKQRVSIARAFHKNSPIFVLDDSTSALDINTERALLKTIDDNFADKTLIITAHRFSSVVNCDEILYMLDGEIIERGTFKELMELNGKFARTYNIQHEQQKSVIDEKRVTNGGEK